MRLMVTTISWAPSTTSTRSLAVSVAMRVPFSTAFTEPSMRAEVLLEASADLLARLRSSSATTAKPLPAAPARAASTAALRARMLVWKAISSMVLMILAISLDFSLISPMAAVISCIWVLLWSIFWPTSSAIWLACWALSALALICSEMSLMVAASSSTEEACSVAPWERAWAPEETWSAPEETSSAAW